MPRLLLVLCCVALTGCAASAARPSGAGNPTTLTEAEIRESGAGNAYELVEQLRPRWLRSGVQRSIRLRTVILVYYDNVRLGEIDVLRTLATVPIRSMHVLDAAQAGTLPGLGSQHVERVIMISTTRPLDPQQEQ
jgi:hypothetical protein